MDIFHNVIFVCQQYVKYNKKEHLASQNHWQLRGIAV